MTRLSKFACIDMERVGTNYCIEADSPKGVGFFYCRTLLAAKVHVILLQGR